MWYSISYINYVRLMLPLQLRQTKVMAYLEALVFPLFNLHTVWKIYREDNLYRLDHTGQVCYLRGALNDSFDVDLRRIYIDGSGGDAAKTYIYTPGENQTKYLGTLYIRNSLEFADTGADFLVYVPTSIANTMNYELRALIDFYKVASKRYLIIEI